MDILEIGRNFGAGLKDETLVLGSSYGGMWIREELDGQVSGLLPNRAHAILIEKRIIGLILPSSI